LASFVADLDCHFAAVGVGQYVSGNFGQRHRDFDLCFLYSGQLRSPLIGDENAVVANIKEVAGHYGAERAGRWFGCRLLVDGRTPGLSK
jgi:hypothetical protein